MSMGASRCCVGAGLVSLVMGVLSERRPWGCSIY